MSGSAELSPFQRRNIILLITLIIMAIIWIETIKSIRTIMFSMTIIDHFDRGKWSWFCSVGIESNVVNVVD